MNIRDTERGYILKLSRGEKVIETLTNFCASRGIRSGAFTGIGAVKNATIGYYDLAARRYFFKGFPEDREVASMNGNIAMVEGKPYLHVHAVLSKMDDSLSCVGAHLKEADVAVTLEVFLTDYGVSVERRLDEEVGLKLLHI